MVNYMHGLNNQAQAVAASEGMVGTGTIAQEMDRLAGTPKFDRSEIIHKMTEAGNKKDISNALLKDLFTKLSQSGMVFESQAPITKTNDSTKKSEGEKKADLSTEFSDSISLSPKVDQEKIINIKSLGNRADNAKQEINKNWQEMAEQLKEQGKTKQEISMMEQQYKTSQSQKQMLGLLKDAATMYYLDSDTKLDKIIRRRGFAEQLSKAGKELGIQAAAEAKEGLKGFVLQEMENQLIYKTFVQDKDFESCYRLVKLGDKVGADTVQYVTKVWPQKKEDLGLNLLDVPVEVTAGLTVDVHTDRDAQKQRNKFELKDDEQHDLMMGRLRALYMQLALDPRSTQTPTTWIKIWKLKNGMMQLKIFTKDIDENVKAEAKTLAKLKTMEILEEGLHELATFFKDGPDKKITEQKIKSCMKNLDRLGFKLTDQEFVTLKTKAFNDILEITKRELETTKKEETIEQMQKLIKYLEGELSCPQ